MDPDAYPLLVGAARQAGENAAEARFAFALHALLAGFEGELSDVPTVV
ncbi:hypothetical protein [Streptomyces atroolivaceus]